MLFVLTANLHCMLFGFNSKTQQVDLISKGYLKDQACTLREPPYQVFLSQNSKYIILMLYDNCLKIIPILKNSQSHIQLANAFDVRIQHAEINMVVPVVGFKEGKPNSQSLAVFSTQKIIQSGFLKKNTRKQVINYY